MSAVKPVSAITSDTYNRLLMDSGAVFIDYGLAGERCIGATRGGNSLAIETEYREMPADGAPGSVKGSQRILRSSAKLTVNLLEITTQAIKDLLPGASSAVDSGTHDKITRDCQITTDDYFDNITLVLQKNGTTELFAVKLANAISLGNYELGAAEDDESVMTMEFTAHFDADDLATSPWSIFNPLEAAITYYTLTYTAGANGSIIGDGSQSIASGADGEAVYAAADALYEFTAWDDASTDNPRTDLAVGADVTVAATFTLI